MAGFGRPPKPDGQRRNWTPPMGGAIIKLPAAGRLGKAPKWPLGANQAGETELWNRLWRMPQALMWERLDSVDSVAWYVRLTNEALRGMRTSIVMTEIRQLADRLGLSPMAMLRLRWQIEETVEPENKSEDGILDIRKRLEGSA